MESEASDFLLDILEFGEEVINFVEGRDSERAEIEQMRYLAVEWLLELISEALKRALLIDPALEATIPNASRIRGMRNRLAHEYDSVTFEIVWDTARIHVPILMEAIGSVMRTPDKPEGS